MGWVANPKLPPVFRQFEIPRPDGSRIVAFLSDFNGGVSKRKFLMVYLDGSGAQSLFTIANGRTGVGLFGVLARMASARYHVASVEKRGVKFGECDRPGSAESASLEYTRHATRDRRVADVRSLLDTLVRQRQVDSRRIVLVGHSEGADVAAAVAAVDSRVTHVAFLSGGGPTQMFDLLVLTRKRMARENKSPAEIEAAIRTLEDRFRQILTDPDSETKSFMGHAYRRWSSFFRSSPAEALLRTEARLFLAHGTEDESVPIESFDYLVVELLRANKEGVVVRRYPGRDHGLSDSNRPSGRPPMTDVFEEILTWSLGNP
jgi:pimeloyl-ACP methyl ester carboxylesterase